MTDAVLIDIATKVEPSIEVVFIDTGYHFPETLETVELVRRRYGLNLRIMTVPPEPVACVEGRPGQLLRLRQGGPAGAGAGRQAGLDERAAPAGGAAPGPDAPIVSRDRRGLVKVNPIGQLDRPRRGGLHRRPRRPGQPAARARATPRSVAGPAPGRWRRASTSRAGRWSGSTRPSAGCTTKSSVDARRQVGVPGTAAPHPLKLV